MTDEERIALLKRYYEYKQQKNRETLIRRNVLLIDAMARHKERDAN